MKEDTAHRISVALGRLPADLLLTNARVINTFTGEIEQANVAVAGDRIAGVGDYEQAAKVVDLEGRFLAPGFIDGHVHLESSMLHPAQYARAVVPHGVAGIVSDLHEIANVAGFAGIRYIMNWMRRLPLELFLMVPSCVPATDLETAGDRLTAEDVRTALRWKNVIGLGEMMNFPGVLAQDEAVLAKLSSSRGRVVDGHAPSLKGKELNAYIAAGIHSDHESVTYEEAREKLRRGMHIMIREGSSEKNLESLLPLVNDNTYQRCLFVVDDRSCADLVRDGDIDAVVRKAVRLGLAPVRAIQLVTINPARYFCLQSLGAISPGYYADMIVLNDLDSLKVDMVFHRGKLVARGGQPLFSPPGSDKGLSYTVHIKPFDISALRIPASHRDDPIIEVVPGQIITKKVREEAKVSGGQVVPDPERDILKLVVVERHQATGNIGRGLVKGFGLKKGALASSIAHDSHNVVAVGTNDRDIYAAVKEVERLGGGLVIASQGKVLYSLPLPIAGLLSDLPLEVVATRLEDLEKAAKEMGTKLTSPFSTLSFLALPVIPELRLTDRGLVDVTKFELLG